MTARLEHTPANPTEASLTNFSVDNSDAHVSFGNAFATDAQSCNVPESSNDRDWRKDPTKDRPLGFSWRMRSEELNAVLDLPVMDTPLEQEVLDAVVADGIVSAHLYPGRRVSYSRRSEHWTQRMRYTGPGWRRDVITRVIDKLVEGGILIEHDRRPPGMRRVQSSYLPNPLLATFAMPKLTKRRGESLILRNAEGELLAYKDTPQTRDRRYMLDRVNSVLSRTEFSIAGNEAMSDGRWMKINDTLLSTTQTAMHRVYNGEWALGGRFYGGFWMSMPGDDRRHILIDGHETAEVDYDMLHARIIYAWTKKRGLREEGRQACLLHHRQRADLSFRQGSGRRVSDEENDEPEAGGQTYRRHEGTSQAGRQILPLGSRLEATESGQRDGRVRPARHDHAEGHPLPADP
ncbi:hypothetical protein ACC760_07240 [Rhizobium ruizarguesonis]